MLQDRLLKAWQTKSLWAWGLRPAAALYGFLLRRKARRFTPLDQPAGQRPPIIVVGNVLVGGVGKTPIVMALVQHLQSLGYRPGVISRGYGRQQSSVAPLAILPATPAAQAGDEALLIAQTTGAPVFVAANRPAALAALCAAHPEVNVVLSDDGLQHWALPRDVEIVVWDARGLGNGYLLPAGPLREPWPRQPWHPYFKGTQVWQLFRTGQEGTHASPEQAPHAWPVVRHLADYALQANGSRLGLSAFPQQHLRALAGIAQPEAFFADLRAGGLALQQTVALPDHADVAAWWQSLDAEAQSATWVCTEKDAVKLWAVCPQAWAVPLVVELPAPFLQALAGFLADQQNPDSSLS